MKQLKKSDHCNMSEVDIIAKSFKLLKKEYPSAELEYHRGNKIWWYHITLGSKHKILHASIITALARIGLYYSVSSNKDMLGLIP